MSNYKQSSIEWLISQLQRSKDWHRVLNEISQMSSARVDIIRQAKARHFDEQEQLLFKYFEWHKRKGYEKHELDHFTEFYKENYKETYES